MKRLKRAQRQALLLFLFGCVVQASASLGFVTELLTCGCSRRNKKNPGAASTTQQQAAKEQTEEKEQPQVKSTVAKRSKTRFSQGLPQTVFAEDLNMPLLRKYGTQPLVSLRGEPAQQLLRSFMLSRSGLPRQQNLLMSCQPVTDDRVLSRQERQFRSLFNRRIEACPPWLFADRSPDASTQVDVFARWYPRAQAPTIECRFRAPGRQQPHAILRCVPSNPLDLSIAPHEPLPGLMEIFRTLARSCCRPMMPTSTPPVDFRFDLFTRRACGSPLPLLSAERIAQEEAKKAAQEEDEKAAQEEEEEKAASEEEKAAQEEEKAAPQEEKAAQEEEKAAQEEEKAAHKGANRVAREEARTGAEGNPIVV